MILSLIVRVSLLFSIAILIVPPTVFAQSDSDTLLYQRINEIEQPSFIDEIDSQEAYEALTNEEKAELKAYYEKWKTTQSGSSNLSDTGLSCFDYYSFGSVQVDVESSVSSATNGSLLTFTGTIENSNPYPVVSGQVAVKIFRKNITDEAFAMQNGYPVVDQFIVLDNVSVAAMAKNEISFDWTVPNYLESGDYELVTYFMSDKRFNFLGLPFTDDVTGNKAEFSIISNSVGTISLSKNNTTLNGSKYQYIAFPPHFELDESVQVVAEVTNTTGTKQDVPVTWTLYNWSAEREENKLDSRTEVVTLMPGETKKVSYLANKTKGSVYFLTATVEYFDVKSILNIRFVRDNVEDARLNYVGIMDYPLVAGQENTLVSCFHSTNLDLIPGGKIHFSIIDSENNIVHSYVYTGSISGDMSAVKDSFTPTYSLSEFTLLSSFELNGQIIEESSIVYSCEEIDESLCINGVSSNEDHKVTYILVGLFTIFLILITMYFFRKKDIIKENIVSLTVVFLTFFSVSLLLVPHTVLAKSVTITQVVAPDLYYYWDFSSIKTSYKTDTIPLKTSVPGTVCEWCVFPWSLALKEGTSAQVTHKAQLINDSSGDVITDGSLVPVGTKIRVEKIKENDTDVAWSGSARSTGTPYGHWVKDAGPLPNACKAEDYVSTTVNFNVPNATFSFATYVLFNVDPVIPTVVSPSSNLSCAGNICTVTSTGPVSVGLQFPATKGMFYHRYRASNGPCYGTNVPLRGDSTLSSPYVVSFPSRTINFSLSAVEPNNPPGIPTVSPAAGNNNTYGESQSFMIQSSDIDNDDLRYGIDWNRDGSVDQWSPSSGYVNSGTVSNVTRTWATSGTYTFQVIAQDINGALSGWRSYSIEIISPVYACMGDAPTNASICAGDDAGLSSNTISSIVSACTSAKCEYICATGYFKGSNSCIKTQCNDGIDNYDIEDTLIDLADPGCSDANDNDESNPAKIATINATDCTISAGNSTCVSSVTWSSSYTTSRSIRQDGLQFSTAPSSGDVPRTVGYGTSNFVFIDNGLMLVSDIAMANCGSGLVWNGLQCDVPIAPKPNLNAYLPDAVPVTTAGSAIDLTSNVANEGTASAGPYNLKFYIDSNSDGVADYPPVVVREGDSTASGVLESESVSWTIPVSVVGGAWQIGYYADSDDEVSEIGSDGPWNNWSGWRSFTVTADPAATLSGYGCKIKSGESTCDGTFTWVITDALNPVIYNVSNSILCSNNMIGTDESCRLNFGSNLIEARDDTTMLDSVTVAAQCNIGDIWDPVAQVCSIIPAPPSLTVIPSSDIVRSGQPAVVDINVTANYDLTCTVYGVEPSVETFVHTASPDKETYTYNTFPLTSAQLVRVNCVTLGVDASDEVRINIVPDVEET